MMTDNISEISHIHRYGINCLWAGGGGGGGGGVIVVAWFPLATSLHQYLHAQNVLNWPILVVTSIILIQSLG